MASERFPVLMVEDHAGAFTAILIAWYWPAPISGRGSSRRAALTSLRQQLRWLARKHPDQLPEPELEEARLRQITVSVRPEYRAEERIYPCETPVKLSISCVWGETRSGVYLAVLPMLDIELYFYEEGKLQALVQHYVRDWFQEYTPQELAPYLPPRRVELQELSVVLPARHRSGGAPAWQPEVLSEVADPVNERGIRRRFAAAWERDAEVTDLVRRIEDDDACILLVGDSGVGKTTVLVNAVRKVDGSSSQPRCWQTSSRRLIAGMRYLGQWEERCQEVIEKLAGIDGILCAESLLDLVRTGGRGAVDSVAAFLRTFIESGELRLIAEATPREVAACRRLLPGFVELFRIVRIEPFARAAALRVLAAVTGSLHQRYQVSAGAGVVETVERLFRRFLPYDPFPGKACAFLQRLFVAARQESQRPEVTVEQVLQAFTTMTGLPEVFLRDDLPLGADEVAAALEQQVLGQDHACDAVARIVTQLKAGLCDPNRPVGVLLLCGPTGVGKTRLATCLADYCFGDGRQRLVRIDMSELAGIGAAERLIGSEHQGPSELIKRVRQQPFVVVLLDEVEKAAPEVFDILLNVLDEGRLGDSYGRVTNFCSSIILMTSNLGATARDSIGFERSTTPAYEQEVQRFFRPELVNRIDQLVVFDPLSPATAEAITRKELAEIEQREGLEARQLHLQWRDEVVQALVGKGFDPRYGARPLQRAIEEMIVAPLARWLLRSSPRPGTTIEVALAGGEVTFASPDAP
jgi:ATP-dependent Clp protease ATP-binding subunit ClpC